MPHLTDAVICAKGAPTKYWVHKWTYFKELELFCFANHYFFFDWLIDRSWNIRIFWDTGFLTFMSFHISPFEMFYFTCNGSRIYERFTFSNKLQKRKNIFTIFNLCRCTCIYTGQSHYLEGIPYIVKNKNYTKKITLIISYFYFPSSLLYLYSC